MLLAGQLALDERLAEPTHHALDRRIVTIARLLPLSPEEIHEYVAARVRAAGIAKGQLVFEDGAVDAVAEATGGIHRPRQHTRHRGSHRRGRA